MANALMKAETKAKRRVTLSICGLGLLDESEIDTMKGAETYDVHHEVVQTNTSNYQQAPKEIPADDFKPEAASKYGLQPEDMELWTGVVNQCKDNTELKTLYNKEREKFDKYPPLMGLLSTRKQSLSNQAA